MPRKIVPAVCALLCLAAVAAPAHTQERRAHARRAAAATARARTTAAARRQTQAARRIVTTERAPRAIGPYSQAVVANGFVFCSGQIGFDPATGRMVEGGTREQTEQVLKNLAAVLEAAGSDLSLVTKTTVFLADMDDFAAMNEVYQRHFKTNFPARSTVQVARLPRDARIEIEAIALLKRR